MDISVRTCTEDEALEYVQDPSVVKWLSDFPVKIKDEFIMLVMDERVLVLVKTNKQSVEVHIACKYRDRAGVRETLENGLEWFKRLGYTNVWTKAPDDRVGLVRMLESLKFRKVKQRWVWE